MAKRSVPDTKLEQPPKKKIKLIHNDDNISEYVKEDTPLSVDYSTEYNSDESKDDAEILLKLETKLLLTVLETFYYEGLHPLPQTLCELIALFVFGIYDENKYKYTYDWVIIVRIVPACYNKYVRLYHKLLYDETMDSAIDIGKKFFYNEVLNAFRYNIKDRFKFKIVDEYGSDWFVQLWQESDSGGSESTTPNGPAILQIFRHYKYVSIEYDGDIFGMDEFDIRGSRSFELRRCVFNIPESESMNYSDDELLAIKDVHENEYKQEYSYLPGISIFEGFKHELLHYFYEYSQHTLKEIMYLFCDILAEYCYSRYVRNDYLVITRIVIACYDVHCYVYHKILYQTTKEDAIQFGQNVFYRTIQDSFRDNIDGFNRNNIETYDSKWMKQLWEECDCNGQEYTRPRGPAILEIFEYNRDKPIIYNEVPQQTNNLIYFLPKS